MKTVRLFVTTILVLLSCSSVFSQNYELKGVVTDAETGEPIPFASVFLKGTTIGVACDENGAYDIMIPVGKENVIIYSSIGYQKKEITVGKEMTLNVALDADVNALQETMVVAFGTSTKESFTGSAAVVKSSDIAKTQSSDATRALEGVVAGVQMTTASGTPGSSPSIVIRGISSISAGTAPLYVVDGVPYPGDINNINPADIESMTVLKDAASNALYGARGANGVIMITTKKAKTQDAVVNLDMKLGWNSKALREYDYVRDPGLYYEMHYGALRDYYRYEQGLSPLEAHRVAAANLTGPAKGGGLGYDIYTYPEGEFLIGANGKLNPNATLGRVVNYEGQDYYLTSDDWMKEAYRNSLRQEYNLSVTGRTDKASFYASFGYLYDKGIIRYSNMARYTARLKADYQAKKWLKVGGNAAFTHFSYGNSNGNEGSTDTGNMFAFANSIAPIYPLYMRDGKGNIMHDKYGHRRYDFGSGANAGFRRPAQMNANPYQLLELDKNRSEGNSFNGTAFADITFLKDFKFSFNAGFGVTESRVTNLSNNLYGQFVPDGGILAKGHSRDTHLNLQELLTYDKTFAGKHHLNVMVGHENYLAQSYSLSAAKKKLFSLDNLELGGAVIDAKQASSGYGEYNNEGYFLRVQYDYNNKIFTSASYRRDASSKFHPDHRWGNFWSVGAGWLINHEPWFHASWVDMLKLKASVGSQGNDSIANYLYTDMYNISNNDDEIAVSFARKGNENITWETNTNFNIGVDFDLFNGKIGGSIEYFYRLTSDMLFYFTVPASLGYGGYYDNIGDMRNSGVELALNFNPIRTKNVNWSIYANLTHYSNKITMLPNEKKTRKIEGYKGYANGTKFVGEGLPLNTFFLPKYAGVEQETGLPMWYKDIYQLDADGNPVLDADKEPIVIGKETTTKYSDASTYLCGNPIPKVYGGFGTSIDFYGFDLAFQFTYQIGGLVYDSGYASLMSSPGGSTGTNFHKDLLDAWTPENHSASIPRFRYLDQDITATSDRWLTDASYLNFQNAQFGYTLPRNLTRKIKVEKMRFYVSCDNICYVSHRRGLDPRQSFTGTTNDAMNSPVRTLSGGLSITF